jgi:hypothetical protein
VTGKRLEIEGWAVAQADLQRPWSRQQLPERCWVFRSSSHWALVAMRRSQRFDDHDRIVDGRAVIRSEVFASLAELAQHVERTYTGGAWVELVDTGAEFDPDLHAVWVPEQIRRDFDGASFHRKDLARCSALLAGSAVPAPARELPGWEEDAVAQMATRLGDLGFEVLDGRPSVDDNTEGWEDPQLGTVHVHRYGWETVGVVRVDEVGEVFVRLPDPANVAGPLFRPAPEDDA